ncbi:MAG TPA: low molecular weight protein-tyrosine-phosphatase [Paenibacillus sp.]
MINVVFVCLGNICRSPMAEAVLRNKIASKNLQGQINVDSAGTGDWHIGHPPHEGTRKILDEYQISYEGMVARQVTSQDFEQFDYVLCMDQANLGNLRKLPGGENAVIIPFMELLPDEVLREVPDPYFTGNFEEVYALINAGCDVLLDMIVEDKL